MKSLNRSKILKTISLMLVIIFITNTLIPTPSYADTDEDLGGKLFRPVAQLLAFFADLAIELAQDFLWDGSNINKDNGYRVYIGPATIFTGQIPRIRCKFYKSK